MRVRAKDNLSIEHKPDNAETPLEDEFDDVERSFKDLLSFYGVELQSHGSIVIGIALLAFAMIQAKGQLSGDVFSIILGLMGAGVIYELLRLYVYGKLASSLTSGTMADYNQVKQKFEREHKGGAEPENWKDLSDLAKVNYFTSWKFERSVTPLPAKVLRQLVLNKSRQVKSGFIIAVFWVSSIASGLIFQSFNQGFFFLVTALGIGGFVIKHALWNAADARLRAQHDKSKIQAT